MGSGARPIGREPVRVVRSRHRQPHDPR